MNDLSGRTIRGYEIREQIGAGGFGAVYRAFQPILKREVAIKVILPEYANSPDFIRRFEIEAEVVARLEHPHIVPLFDYWREPDSAYLVMRLLRGGTLQDIIEDNTPSLEQIADIMDQIASALHISHRNGVVHRDIKPGNILLDEDGNAYLTDFGIAQSTDYESITGDEGITGSISHTPPEQLQGGKITPQTDIYALGIIFYQMLAGDHPFSEATVSQMVFKHISDPVPDLERDDLPYEINDILQKATAKNPEDRHADVRDMASEFRALISGSTTVQQISEEDFFIFVDVDNPYKGLRAFQEADADQFFGRSALTERLLDRLSEPSDDARFLAVVGPSGSGKSSVVKAGLLPAIRRGRLRNSENWFIVEMFPGISPFAELESALMRVAVNPVESLMGQVAEENGISKVLRQILPDDNSELVLVIDQFEELFTQVDSEETRTRFLDNLVESVQAKDSRLRVIVTMRADFYDKPLQYREFGELLRKRIETVLPMSPDELVETITMPAQSVGIDFQPGLVEAISQDVGEQPGMLPLLQYTMTELFDGREGQILTLTAYQTIGGVTGSLARRSEELYTGLDASGQQATRQLFLRLVSLGEGTEDTRRRVRRSELATTDAIDEVINLYGQYRLLTFDKDPSSREPTVEVAHEALIRTWERLRTWINESREDLRVQHRVSAAVTEWLGSGKDNSFLASGARLSQFQEWRDNTELILNEDEKTYIQTSIDAEAARKAREMAIARRVQNFQRASIILGAMVILAIVATGFFLNRASQAQQQVSQANATLTPAQATVAAAENVVASADAQVAVAATQAEDAVIQAQSAANDVVTAQAEATIAGNFASTAQIEATNAQNQLDIASTQIGNASTQQAVVQQLTEIVPTNEFVNERVSNLETEVQNVAVTLTPAQATVNAAAGVVVEAQSTVSAAQQDVALAENDLATSQAGAIVAQTEVAQAESNIATSQAESDLAQTEVAIAENDVATSQAEAVVAQTEVGVAQNDASTSQAEAVVAQNDAATAQFEVDAVAETVVAGNAQAETQQADLSTAQVLAGNAQTQAAVVVALTNIAPTIDAADERVANLEATLTPVQSTIDAAQAEVANVGLTLTPIQQQIADAENQAATAQAGADEVQREADSISLAVNAEQAIDVGDYDLALALTFESLNLNAGQARARRILNEVAFGTARMSFDGVTVNAISPDSRYFAIAEGNDVIIFDVSTRAEITRLTGHQAPVLSIAFSDDVTRIATGSQDATARLWDISGLQNGGTAPELFAVSGHTGAVTVVAFGSNPSLPTLFTGSQDSNIIEWSLSNGSLVREYTGNSWAIADIRFVGDGGGFFTTVLANETPILLYWRVGNVNPTSTFEVLYDVYNDDATRGTRGGRNGFPLEVYNTTQQAIVRPLNTRDFNWGNETATAFAFRPGGAEGLVALDSAQGEDRLVLVSLASGEIVRTFVGQASQSVDALAFNPNGDLAISANEGILTLWNVQTGTALRTLASHADVIIDISWSADGRFAVTRSRDNNVRVWDITGADEALRQIFPIETTLNRGKFPGFNSRGDQVVAAVWVNFFNWNLQTGIRGETVSTGDEVINMIYSPIEPRAISILPNVARLWDLDSGANGFIRTYGDESAQFTGQAAYSPDGAFVAFDDATRILVYEIETGRRQTINKPRFDDGQVVTGIAVSPDGRYVVTSIGTPFQQEAPSGDIILWDTETGSEVYRFPQGHTRTVNRVEYSIDGNRVLTASDDDTLILWTVTAESATISRRFAGHLDDVNVGLFVPNNGQSETLILSASDDRTMILWDIQSGQSQRTFRGSPSAITGLGISADGSQMVTSYGNLNPELSRQEPIPGSAETFIYVWELTSTDDLIEWTANNRFIRNLTSAECEQYGIQECNTSDSVPVSGDSSATQIIPPTTVPDSNDSAQATTAPEPTEASGESSANVVNSGGQGLNVRSTNSTSASVVTTLQAGETAAIVGRSTDSIPWYQIRLENGQIGWVRSDIVATDGDVLSAPIVNPPPLAPVQPTAVPDNSSGNSNPPPTAASASSGANLQITGIGFAPDPPQCLQAFTVQLNIQNTGTEATTADATVFVRSIHLASGSEGAQGSGTVPALAPGANWVVEVSLTVSTFLAEEHQIQAQVDSGGVIPESNDGDNFSSRNYTLGSGSC